MPRLLKCKLCGTTGYEMYSPTGKAPYYCNKEEYEVFQEDSNKRIELNKYIATMIGLPFLPPVGLKRVNKLREYYTYDVITETFKEHKSNIEWWVAEKDFSSDSNMINYVFAIIENNINDVYKKMEIKRKQQAEMQKTIANADMEDFELVNQNIGKKSNDISMFL